MKYRQTFTYRLFSGWLSLVLAVTFTVPVQAQNVLNLPAPGIMIMPSASFTPVTINGMIIDTENPFRFDFIIDRSDDNFEGDTFKAEAQKVIRYFLTSLTVPDDEMWVNLSPYEQDRIIADGLGRTEMGRDMLAQDYLLKQLTASLMYPDEELGEEFWKRVYKKSEDLFGTSEIPTNTFNKIWIVPQDASVYVNENKVFVVKSHLSIMLEQDYLAMKINQGHIKHGVGSVPEGERDVLSDTAKQVVKEVIIPAIEHEVNHGKTFANLRQIYHSMILATWYKQHLRSSAFGQRYIDRNKTDGIDAEDKNIKHKIYQQYVEAFKKGVFDFIREDYDPTTQEMIPRKYFSGGLEKVNGVYQKQPSVEWVTEQSDRDQAIVSTDMLMISDKAMNPSQQSEIPQREYPEVFDEFDPKQYYFSVVYNPEYSGRYRFDRITLQRLIDEKVSTKKMDGPNSPIKREVDDMIGDMESRATNTYSYSHGNFIGNDWFVIYEGSTRQVYHRSQEPILERTYPMVVVWEEGSVSAEQIQFLQDGDNVIPKILDNPERDPTQIKQAFFGQQLIENGAPTPWQKLYNQFDDLNHLYTFPQFLKEVDGEQRDGEALGVSELYVDIEMPGKRVDRKELLKVIQNEGYLELDLLNYFSRYSLEQIKNDALVRKGYREKKEGVLAEGEFRIEGSLLQIKLLKTKYPHNLIGITRSGKIIMINITGDKRVGVGKTIDEIRELIMSKNQNRSDPINDVFLLANSGDVFKRHNGTIIEKESAGLPRSYQAAVLVLEEKNLGDPATISEVGGIDFNPNALNLQSQGVSLPFTLPSLKPDVINDIHTTGYSPVIINVTSVTNFSALIGFKVN